MSVWIAVFLTSRRILHHNFVAQPGSTDLCCIFGTERISYVLFAKLLLRTELMRNYRRYQTVAVGPKKNDGRTRLVTEYYLNFAR